MAQTNVWAMIASSNLVAVPEDISDLIQEIAPWETPLLTTVGLDSLQKPCSNVVHQYLEQQERPKRTTLNGDIDASTTTVVFTDAVYVAGEQVQIDAEVILLGSTSDNLTFTSCTRSVNYGSAAAHSSGSICVGFGKAKAQGAAAGSTSDLMVYPNQVTTYTRIFSKDIVVTGTANVLARYGRTEGSEFDAVAMRQLKTLKKELENALIWDTAQAPSGTSTAGRFDGIFDRVKPVNSADLGSQSLDLSSLRDGVRTIRDYGGMPSHLLCSYYQAQVIDSFGQSHVQHVTDPNDPAVMTYGVSVSRLFISGATINVLPMDCMSTNAFLIDSTKIGVGPLEGRQFQIIPMGQDGDRVKAMAIGEYTVEIACPRAHYVYTTVKNS